MCGAGHINRKGAAIYRGGRAAWLAMGERGTRGGVGWEDDPREARESRGQPMDRSGLDCSTRILQQEERERE